VPTAKGGPAEPVTPRNLHRFLPYYRLLARKAVNKAGGVALGRALLPSGDGASPLLAHAAAQLVDELRRSGPLRDGELLTAGLLRPEVVGAWGRGDAASPPPASAALDRLLTVELALRAARGPRR
jgi:hypothetical protein